MRASARRSLGIRRSFLNRVGRRLSRLVGMISARFARFAMGAGLAQGARHRRPPASRRRASSAGAILRRIGADDRLGRWSRHAGWLLPCRVPLLATAAPVPQAPAAARPPARWCGDRPCTRARTTLPCVARQFGQRQPARMLVPRRRRASPPPPASPAGVLRDGDDHLPSNPTGRARRRPPGRRAVQHRLISRDDGSRPIITSAARPDRCSCPCKSIALRPGAVPGAGGRAAKPAPLIVPAFMCRPRSQISPGSSAGSGAPSVADGHLPLRRRPAEAGAEALASAAISSATSGLEHRDRAEAPLMP